MRDEVRKAAFLLTVVFTVLAFACGGKIDEGNNGSVVDPSNATPAFRATHIVTDDLGRTVTIPVKVTRVVSLAPSVTENIFAVGAGDRLVGVTTFCNYPEEAKAIAKVGDTMTPNMETIVALKPDIVFVSTASQIEAFTKTLDQNGIAVYVMDLARTADIYENFMKLGTIFNTSETADKAGLDLDARRREVCRKTDGCLDRDKDGPAADAVRVFVQISKEPLFTAGENSFLTELIQDAGGISVTSKIKTAFPKLSKETALALQPEAIILSGSPDNQEPNEVFKNSPAVKNGRVYKINADILSRPGPRLVDALEEIAKKLHPEKFPE